MELKEFGKYIKNIRESKKISLRQVDYLSEITFSNLSMIENGTRRATPFILKELSKVYDVNYIELLQKAGYIDLAEKETIDSIEAKSKKNKIVNVYSSVHAGILSEMIENIVDTEEISEKMVNSDKTYFGIKVKGDSMSPKYIENDTLIVEKCNSCNSGEDCIVAVNGDEAFLKRVYLNENGITLQALNPNYKPLVYTNKEIKDIPITIIGIVRELRRKI